MSGAKAAAIVRISFAAAGALALAACASIPRGGDERTLLLGAVARCGIETRAGAVLYDPAQALVTMTRGQHVSARATQCLAGLLLDRGLDLKAADPAFAYSYAEAWERANAAVGPAMARLWLRKNVQGRVPRFAPRRETLGRYLRKLERLCGAPPESVAAEGDTVRIPWLDGPENEQVSCVYLAALASNLGEAGVRVVADKEPARIPGPG